MKSVKKLVQRYPLLYAIAYRIKSHFKLIKPEMHEINTAHHFYSVWLKHLILLNRNSIWREPKVIVEFGPGASLGTGYSALLSGANKYYAIDVVPYVNTNSEISIFNEIISLFNSHAKLDVKVSADENLEFPHQILDDKLLKRTLDHSRIETIKNSISDIFNPNHFGDSDIAIKYFSNSEKLSEIKRESVDMVLSTAVLEHVTNLDYIYSQMRNWLKPNGVMSHFIDFRSHNLSEFWNGHWAFSDIAWTIMTGKTPYLLNREPISTHLNLLCKYGFTIAGDHRWLEAAGDSALSRVQLAKQWQAKLTNEDLSTKGSFLQAIKSN